MLTFNQLKTRFGKITSDSTTANLTFGGELINETHQNICAMYNWPWTVKTLNRTSTASQQQIILPADFGKLITYTVKNGNTEYTPIEIANPMEFDIRNATTTDFTSNYPVYFHIRGGVLYNYPAISSADLTIKIVYHARPKKMTADDYSTGTIVAIANNATTVTGDGTTWTTDMAGRYILMPDGLWYEISSVEDTTEIELAKPYQGVTVAAGSETYTIGEIPLVPEDFQELLWTKPTGIYYLMKGKPDVAAVYYSGKKRKPGMYESQLSELRRVYSTQTTQNVYPSRAGVRILNPNDYPENLS